MQHYKRNSHSQLFSQVIEYLCFDLFIELLTSDYRRRVSILRVKNSVYTKVFV